MYAIIRTGGKQTKVHEGDVIDVEHLRVEGEVDFAPLLLVDDAGTVFSQRNALQGVRVVARVVGESSGPKVDLFKYKAKTGYRRHQGHRQRYTTLEVVRIGLPEGAKRNPPAEKQTEPAPADVSEPATPAKKPAPAAAKARTAAKKPAPAAAKARTAAKKPAPAAAKARTAAKKPAPAAAKARTAAKKPADTKKKES
jgi:large subunit ribosomal protein L21